MPRAAATLGLRFLSADPDAGRMEVEFNATEAFTNPTGNVLGVPRRDALRHHRTDTSRDACCGSVSVDARSQCDSFDPLRSGRIIGRGRIVHREGDIALMEASLANPAGDTLAVASAIARVIPLAMWW
jgi:acyl-coenzyme A thioesterase PaaI-like protein